MADNINTKTVISFLGITDLGTGRITGSHTVKKTTTKRGGGYSCWLFGGIVRYRLSSQQKVHRCNSVLEKGKSMRGDNSFLFSSIIYNLWNNPPPYIFDLIPNHSCPVVPY
jgi:hypothetical protein